MRSYPLYIDGRDRDGQGWNYTVRASALLADPMGAFELKRSLELGKRSPEDAPPEVIGRCAWSDESEGVEALEAAKRASIEYARTPIETRRAIGADFGRACFERAEELVEILIAEGHPRRLAEWEVRGVIEGTDANHMDWYFDQMHSEFMQGERRIVLARKPDGVVCLNPPQNAAGSNSALGVGALLAGNTLVVKAPRSTPLSVMFLYREIVAPILERHGAPPGTLNIISGDTRRILRQWISSPLVDDVMFFGDSTVGLKIGADCVAAGKKPVLELLRLQPDLHGPEVRDRAPRDRRRAARSPGEACVGDAPRLPGGPGRRALAGAQDRPLLRQPRRGSRSRCPGPVRRPACRRRG
jgi:acyl-CoA reductase-like NAD-dependent aldehyde dehydrogenase